MLLQETESCQSCGQVADLWHCGRSSWCSLELGLPDINPFVVACRINGMLHEVEPAEQIGVSVNPLRTRDVDLDMKHNE